MLTGCDIILYLRRLRDYEKQLEFIWEFYNWLHKKYKKEIKLQKLIDLFPIYIKKNHHDDKNKCKISKNELF